MVEALYTFLWIGLLLLALRYIPFFRNIPGLPFGILAGLFMVKVMAGFLYALVYTFYFDPATADIHRFFHDGKVLFSALGDNPLDYLRMLTGIGSQAEHLQPYYESMNEWFRPWLSPVYNDNRILIRFNGLLCLVSFGMLQVHLVIAAFISLAGFVALYEFGRRYLPVNRAGWLIPGIFLFPSVLFWSAGIIKETLLFPALGFFLLHTDSMLNRRQITLKSMIIAGAMLFLLLLLKAYVLFLLLPCYVGFRLAQSQTPQRAWLAVPAVLLAYSGLVLLAGILLPAYDLVRLMASKQNEFMLFSLSVEAGSIIEEVYLQPTFSSIMSYLPRGLWNTLAYPNLLEPLTPLTLMAAVENIIIAAMIISLICILIIQKKLPPLAWMGLWFAIITFTFVGTITQVSGSLVRYKVPALPFLWMAVVSILPTPQLEQWLRNRLPGWFIENFDQKPKKHE
jgi:hypothetical protein